MSREIPWEYRQVCEKSLRSKLRLFFPHMVCVNLMSLTVNFFVEKKHPYLST